MDDWLELEWNSNLYQGESKNSYLIKIPKTDWLFYHPIKCVRFFGKRDYIMRISFTKNWNFKLFRKGKSGILDRKELNTIEFLEFIK